MDDITHTYHTHTHRWWLFQWILNGRANCTWAKKKEKSNNKYNVLGAATLCNIQLSTYCLFFVCVCIVFPHNAPGSLYTILVHFGGKKLKHFERTSTGIYIIGIKYQCPPRYSGCPKHPPKSILKYSVFDLKLSASVLCISRSDQTGRLLNTILSSGRYFCFLM